MKIFNSRRKLAQWRYYVTFHDGTKIEMLNSNNFPEQGGEELSKSLWRSGQPVRTITYSPVSSAESWLSWLKGEKTQ